MTAPSPRKRNNGTAATAAPRKIRTETRYPPCWLASVMHTSLVVGWLQHRPNGGKCEGSGETAPRRLDLARPLPQKCGMTSGIKIYLCAPRGFCAGVVRAIDVVERALEIHGAPVYVRHEIVHNKYVV